MSVFKKIDSFVNRVVKNYTLWIFIGLIVLALVALKVYSTIFPPVLEPPVYANLQFLQSDWSPERRQRYYQTSQGSLVMPYNWYRSLEVRTGTLLFSSPQNYARYGLLPDSDPKYNPEQNPIGIVKDIVPDELVNTLGYGHKEWASVSCAACHTGELLYKGTALRIDGGQAFWRFENWSSDLVFSLVVTATIPDKYDRFCSRVNGHEYTKCSNDEKENLHKQLKAYFDSDLITEAVNAAINHTYPNKEGFARTDALGRGVNGVFGPFGPGNIIESSGSVSYPPLWYTHDYDWVQSTTGIRQPLGRNVTEAWGVNVRVELNDAAKRWTTTARMDDLFWIETLVSILKAPKWPENILGPIDRARAERGRKLFYETVWDKALTADQAELPADPSGFMLGPNPERPTTGLCARCHAPAFAPDSNGKRYFQLPLYRQEVMGTSPVDATQFNGRQIHTGHLTSYFGNKPVVGIGEALTVSVGSVVDRWFNDRNVPQNCRTIIEGFRQNAYRAPLGYPARPLDGYWATAPFLHNGSVRTLFELLSPVSERAKTFWIGSREFDPYLVGFRDDEVQGGFLYDTNLRGNSNAGHEFREAAKGTPGVIGPYLTREQRLDIIEFMKVLASVEITQQNIAQRSRMLDAMAPYYENYVASPQYGTAEKQGSWNMPEFCKAIETAAADQPPAPPVIQAAGVATPSPSVSPSTSPSPKK